MSRERRPGTTIGPDKIEDYISYVLNGRARIEKDDNRRNDLPDPQLTEPDGGFNRDGLWNLLGSTNRPSRYED